MEDRAAALRECIAQPMEVLCLSSCDFISAVIEDRLRDMKEARAMQSTQSLDRTVVSFMNGNPHLVPQEIDAVFEPETWNKAIADGFPRGCGILVVVLHTTMALPLLDSLQLHIDFSKRATSALCDATSDPYKEAQAAMTKKVWIKRLEALFVLSGWISMAIYAIFVLSLACPYASTMALRPWGIAALVMAPVDVAIVVAWCAVNPPQYCEDVRRFD